MARADAHDRQLGVERPGRIGAGEVLDRVGDLIEVVEQQPEKGHRAADLETVQIPALPLVVRAPRQRVRTGQRRRARARQHGARGTVGDVVQLHADRRIGEVGGAGHEHRRRIGAGGLTEQVGHRIEVAEEGGEIGARGDRRRTGLEQIPVDADRGRGHRGTVQRAVDLQLPAQLEVQRADRHMVLDVEQQFAAGARRRAAPRC